MQSPRVTHLTTSALNIADLRELARKRLPRGLFDFVDRGSEDDIALANNRAALARIKLCPRVLVDVSKRSQATALFGKPQTMPLAIAPTGPTGLMWYRGEVALARAAARAGIPFTLASPATTAMEEVMAEAGGTQWFQLYMWKDREKSYRILERAKATGFEALLVTVDAIVPPNREFHTRSGFSLPMRLNPRNVADLATHPRWLIGVAGKYWRNGGMPRPRNYSTGKDEPTIVQRIGHTIDKNESLTRDDLRILRDKWPRKLIVKGILHPRDAIAAADCEADGIVVSNHGAISCDAAIAPIDALPAIADVVGERLTILIDSGFRRGSDVVKALALGAHAVLSGRSTLYGLAAGGEAGAYRALEILHEEIHRSLAVLGCPTVAHLTREHVVLSTDDVAKPPGAFA